MAHATMMGPPADTQPATGVYHGKVGMWVFLGSEVMFFTALIGSYIILRFAHPEQWAEFLEYSRQDIIAMRAVSQTLPSWNYRPGHPELALWHLDQRINDRGFAVDLDLAHGAITAVAKEQARLKAETSDATDGDVDSPSQGAALLVHILAEHGVSLPDMRADTLRRRMSDPELPEAVRLLLSIRLESAKTGTAKYRRAAQATSSDGRLRNTLQFAGAQRTSRWAGRTFQPQNMMRPDMPQTEIEAGIEAMKAGCAHLVFPDVMRVAGNAVRGCIVAPPGRKLTVADLANIEGRGLAYLAGEGWKVRAFGDYDAGTGPDLYVLAYAKAFGVPPGQVTEAQRQIGKVMELGLGYQGGVGAFLTFAAVYRMDLEGLAAAVQASTPAERWADAERVRTWAVKNGRDLGLPAHVYVACEVLKKAWRDAHPATVKLWDDLGDAFFRATLNPGITFSAQALRVQRTGAWLRIRLPSGRYLCYLNPEIDEDGNATYSGVNQYTRQWGRIKTYSGKVAENCTQAWARDVLAHNMPAIDAAGYEIVLTEHDELLTETPDSDEFSAETLSAMMSKPPPWARGCPLSAKGFETYRYRKG